MDKRHNLTEATRDMVKKSTDDIKKVAAWPSETTNGVSLRSNDRDFSTFPAIHSLTLNLSLHPFLPAFKKTNPSQTLKGLYIIPLRIPESIPIERGETEDSSGDSEEEC